MATTGKSFALDIKRECEAITKAHTEVVRVAAISLFSFVIKGTPVGNPDLWLVELPDGTYGDYIANRGYPEGYTGGTARASWNLTNGAPNYEPTGKIDKAGETANNVIRELGSMAYTGVYTLASGLPYIERLEDGWSTQAPAGMVKTSVPITESKIPQIKAAAYRKYGVKP